MNKKAFAKSIVTGLIFGLIVYVIVPTVLVFVINVLLSAATVLDPLHAKAHLSDMWGGMITIIVFEVLFFIAVGPTVGAAAVFIAEKINSGWAYFAGAAISLCLHYVFCAILGGGVYLVTSDDVFGSYVVLFAVFISIMGPLLGVTCVAVCRRRRSKGKQI